MSKFFLRGSPHPIPVPPPHPNSLTQRNIPLVFALIELPSDIILGCFLTLFPFFSKKTFFGGSPHPTPVPPPHPNSPYPAEHSPGICAHRITIRHYFRMFFNFISFFQQKKTFFLGGGVHPTPPPWHPHPRYLRLWVHLHFWGQFEETLWDKLNNTNDIIKFLRVSELFLGMDGCSHMGTCMYRGNQWPPKKNFFFLIWVANINIYQGHC